MSLVKMTKEQGASPPQTVKTASAKKVVRYRQNPFYENMEIPMKDRQIRLGKSDDVLLNQRTGECQETHVASYRKVDNDMFVKLFTQNIVQTFHLKSPGIKALNVLIYAVQHFALCKDEIPLDILILEKFKENYGIKLSLPTLTRGIKELVDSKIIARSIRQGFFFINPNFVFNGNRITFSMTIEREKSRPSLDDKDRC